MVTAGEIRGHRCRKRPSFMAQLNLPGFRAGCSLSRVSRGRDGRIAGTSMRQSAASVLQSGLGASGTMDVMGVAGTSPGLLVQPCLPGDSRYREWVELTADAPSANSEVSARAATRLRSLGFVVLAGAAATA